MQHELGGWVYLPLAALCMQCAGHTHADGGAGCTARAKSLSETQRALLRIFQVAQQSRLLGERFCIKWIMTHQRKVIIGDIYLLCSWKIHHLWFVCNSIFAYLKFFLCVYMYSKCVLVCGLCMRVCTHVHTLGHVETRGEYWVFSVPPCFLSWGRLSKWNLVIVKVLTPKDAGVQACAQ